MTHFELIFLSHLHWKHVVHQFIISRAQFILLRILWKEVLMKLFVRMRVAYYKRLLQMTKASTPINVIIAVYRDDAVQLMEEFQKDFSDLVEDPKVNQEFKSFGILLDCIKKKAWLWNEYFCSFFWDKMILEFHQDFFMQSNHDLSDMKSGILKIMARAVAITWAILLKSIPNWKDLPSWW